jgi:hypothetical protein
MTLYGLHSVVSSISSVAVHLKRNVLRDRTLLKGANEKLAKLAHSPFSRRRFDNYPPEKR